MACCEGALQQSWVQRVINRTAMLDSIAFLDRLKELSFLEVLVIDLLACPYATYFKGNQN